MALNKHITTGVNGTINVTTENDTYIVNATANTNYVLPLIKSNGMTYTFYRLDKTSNVVTVSSSSGNFITDKQVPTSSTSFTLETTFGIEIHSLGDTWRVLKLTNSFAADGAYYVSTYVGPAFPYMTNSGVRNVYVPYSGYNSGFVISGIKFLYSTGSSFAHALAAQFITGASSVTSKMINNNAQTPNTITLQVWRWTPSQIASIPANCQGLLITLNNNSNLSNFRIYTVVVF